MFHRDAKRYINFTFFLTKRYWKQFVQFKIGYNDHYELQIHKQYR
jgi:hypothetical protein